ncbi:MAG: hypothetical protein DDT34_00895 [Firmicutes bacterium]|nr:hypothetical protein [Bacillota bacterium]MBT9157178.1 hypothetical protein [Bacillota bacterium]
MLIDKKMLARFLLTVGLVGGIGYYALSHLAPLPLSITKIEPLQEQEVEPVVAPVTPPQRDFFVEHRLERARERSERIELLREIVSNLNSSVEARGKAQMELISISSLQESELQVERLIVGKGFGDAVVFFGKGMAEAIVKAESLTQVEALGVADVIRTVAGVRLQNIRVRFRK